MYIIVDSGDVVAQMEDHFPHQSLGVTKSRDAELGFSDHYSI